jgi:hypothetical protein
MKTRGSRIEDGGWNTRSVLECGGPPPLFPSTDPVRPTESARRLALLALTPKQKDLP